MGNPRERERVNCATAVRPCCLRMVKGVELFEDLSPEAVDRGMSFVGDDKVEGLDRNRGVVLHVALPLIRGGQRVDFLASEFFGCGHGGRVLLLAKL